MKKTWFCQFKEDIQSITVGSPLILLCDGKALEAPLKAESLFIQTREKYSLAILETLKTEKGFLALKVTSYRTGSFEPPFYITDGEQAVRVENLSFQVQSLLTEKDKEPYPAFGPFMTETPYMLFSVFSFICFVSLLGLFFYRLFKRIQFIKKILKKKRLQPAKAFSLRLRGENETGEEAEANERAKAIMNLEKFFRIFLEEELFLPAQNQKIKRIMENLKKYQPKIYKKSGLRIKWLLKEFSNQDPAKGDHNTYMKLKKISQDLVFLIESQNSGREIPGRQEGI